LAGLALGQGRRTRFGTCRLVADVWHVNIQDSFTAATRDLRDTTIGIVHRLQATGSL
jgi:hypothetical protein